MKSITFKSEHTKHTLISILSSKVNSTLEFYQYFVTKRGLSVDYCRAKWICDFVHPAFLGTESEKGLNSHQKQQISDLQ